MYIHVPTGRYPLSVSTIKAENPNTSFPAVFTAALDYVAVAKTDRPVVNAITHKVVELPPVEIDGVWTQQWGTEAYSAEETVANQAAADTALYDGIVASTQVRLDTFAQSRGYDGILSACTYASSSVPKFTAEGQYCVDARDATWAKLLELLAEVQAGTRPRPSGYADVEPELPPLVWPN